MKNSLFIVVLLVVISGGYNVADAQKAKNTGVHQEKIVDNEDAYSAKFEDRISKFPSIKRWNLELNKKGSGFTYIVRSKPVIKAIYYTIQVGIDNGSRFQVCYVFRCYKNGKMFLLDTATDKQIPVVTDIPVSLRHS